MEDLTGSSTRPEGPPDRPVKKDKTPKEENEMRNKYITISLATVIGIVMLIMLFASAVTALNVKAAETESSTSNTVTVSGSHTVIVSPDKSEIHLAVTTKNDTAAKALEQNSKDVTKVIEALKELEIKEKSIVTGSYNIYQDYDYEKNEPSGFNVSTSLIVKDQNIDKTGEVISAAVGAGATEVQYISYTCSNYDEEYENALTDAVAAAKKKAEVLAKAGGKSLGSVQAIVEGYQDTSARYVNKSAATEEVAVEAAMDASVPIMPEDSEIVANVTVTWYLK